ncbi:unnamed protein product, partial [Linum tenue]
MGYIGSCVLARRWERNKLVVRYSSSSSGHGSIFQCSHLKTRVHSRDKIRTFEMCQMPPMMSSGSEQIQTTTNVG